MTVRHAVSMLAATMRPDGFHGTHAGAGFFEGWYVKLVSADHSSRLAVIPGVFLGPAGTDSRADEAFVQVLDGARGRSWYEAYDAAALHAATGRFDVTVGPNRFTEHGLVLDLPGSGLRGEVRFTTPLDPWPVTWRSPGVMGWYGWVPVMECYHGLVSFDHGLSGALELDGVVHDVTGGRGYVEKDWGQAFPAGYVWMQSNHFSRPGVSLSASIAVIPWRRGQFPGFIVGLRLPGPDGHPVLHRFTTYTRARTTVLAVDDDQVRWTLRARSGATLQIGAERARGGLLHAPVRSQMHRRVEETLDARLHVRLTDPAGQVLLADTSVAAGLEVHGDLSSLLTGG
jgi:hypothetical protein